MSATAALAAYLNSYGHYRTPIASQHDITATSLPPSLPPPPLPHQHTHPPPPPVALAETIRYDPQALKGESYYLRLPHPEAVARDPLSVPLAQHRLTPTASFQLAHHRPLPPPLIESHPAARHSTVTATGAVQDRWPVLWPPPPPPPRAPIMPPSRTVTPSHVPAALPHVAASPLPSPLAAVRSARGLSTFTASPLSAICSRMRQVTGNRQRRFATLDPLDQEDDGLIPLVPLSRLLSVRSGRSLPVVLRQSGTTTGLLGTPPPVRPRLPRVPLEDEYDEESDESDDPSTLTQSDWYTHICHLNQECAVGDLMSCAELLL
jgi:hypothetical protein